MSLGLGDLNKKRPAKKTSAGKDITKGKGAWAKQNVVRPWSEPRASDATTDNSDTASSPSITEVAMSVDSFQQESVFSWADLSNSTKLARVHSQLTALETRAQKLIEGPLKLARKFISRESR